MTFRVGRREGPPPYPKYINISAQKPHIHIEGVEALQSKWLKVKALPLSIRRQHILHRVRHRQLFSKRPPLVGVVFLEFDRLGHSHVYREVELPTWLAAAAEIVKAADV